jgi:hypothetical protein
VEGPAVTYELSSLITPETMQAHRATWWAYAGGQRIRREKTMRGQWSFDVTCSCRWDSRIGGGVRSAVEEALGDHRYDEQIKKESVLAHV